MKIAVFGDIGGHFSPLLNGLDTIGVSGFVVPHNTIIIQVGDLIHKGPDSDKIVAFVDRMLRTNPGQWIQLFGNHEGHCLGGPEFWDQNPPLGDHTIATIKEWQDTRIATMSAAIRTADSDFLVSHAGLSYVWWEQVCGQVEEVAKISHILNTLGVREAFHPGSMLFGAQPGEGGVAWANSVTEVYNTWAQAAAQGTDIPFGQIHGHSTGYYWNGWGEKNHITNSLYSGTLELDYEKRHHIVTIGGKKFISTDPGWGGAKIQNAVQYPYIVEGKVLHA